MEHEVGHPSFTVMQYIPKIEKYIGIVVENNFHICPLAKQTRA